jgi:N-acetylneuraminic acid mutarotase
LLESGKVLSTEGQDLLGLSGVSFIYDPASNTWSGATQMLYTRQANTATLLSDGTVLVTGGVLVPSSTTVRYEERYSPTANSWSAVPGMVSSRISHTATLLGSGKVLVAGGSLYGGAATPFNNTLSSSEIYDPTSNTWSSAPSMAAARDQHAATLLPNGQVLVAGGQGSTLQFEPLSSAEIYDPVANTWASAGNMALARVQPASVLLPNGKVLVIGGSATSAGISGPGVMSAEIYDPGTNIWSAAGNMAIASTGSAAVLLKNGTVLACGLVGSTATPSCELYW